MAGGSGLQEPVAGGSGLPDPDALSHDAQMEAMFCSGPNPLDKSKASGSGESPRKKKRASLTSQKTREILLERAELIAEENLLTATKKGEPNEIKAAKRKLQKAKQICELLS